MVVIGVLILTLAASAAVPKTLYVTGELRDSAGKFMGDGSYTARFTLYISPSGGSALWTEVDKITVKNGRYNLVLGTVSPIGLPFTVPYFLGIKIGSKELAPRTPLSHMGYAFYADFAAMSSNADRVEAFTHRVHRSPGIYWR